MIISFETFFRFIVLFPVFQTQFLQTNVWLSRFALVLRIITILYCVSLYLSGKRSVSKITIFVCLLQTELFLVSLFNGRNLWDSVRPMLAYGSAVMIYDMFGDDTDVLFKYIVIYCKALVYGNIISLLVFRNGITMLVNPPYPPVSIWLIGVSNSFVFWLYPAIVFLTIDYYVNSDKKALFSIALASIMNLLSSSSTGLVGTAIFIGVLIIPKFKAVLSPVRVGIIGAVLFVLISIVGSSKFLEPIIVGLLGKDMTFSTRTTIWRNAMVAFIQRPFLGYGLLSNADIISILGKTEYGTIAGTATHCHSQYFQLLFRYGLVGAVLFTTVLIIILVKCSNRRSDISLAFGIGIATIMIMGITEVFEYPIFYFLFAGAFLFEKFEGIKKNNTEEKRWKLFMM